MKNNPMITGGSSVLVAILFSTALEAQNVGIGVSSPQSKLSVNGTTASGGLAIGDATYTSTSGTVAPTNGAIIQGNTGIGILTPQVGLHLNGIQYVAGTGVSGNFYSETANQEGVEIHQGWIGVQRGNEGACLHLSKPSGTTSTFLAGFYLLAL